MLSILIPVYNYDVLPLVLELKYQADNLEIIYEIIVQDDAGEKFIDENSQINSFPNCSFSINTQNLGRGKNINLLCSKSKYDYVLIMEADAFPPNKFYLKNYIELLSESHNVIFGGVKYPDTIPLKGKLLRWKYGINRETKSLSQRLKNNYDFVFTWNLVLKREILLKYPFAEFINKYGYEDVVFLKKLHLNEVSISHIDNPLIHLNTEDDFDFIIKTETAVNNLHYLINSQKLTYKDVKLSLVYLILKKTHLVGIVKAIYMKNKQFLLKNLKSKNPSLYLFDYYKLGYYCSLKK